MGEPDVIAFGFGLGWAGYSIALWGYCLVKGYDVTLGQLINPVNRYTGSWPPPPAPNTVILPTGRMDKEASAGNARAAAGPAAPAAPPSGGPPVQAV